MNLLKTIEKMRSGEIVNEDEEWKDLTGFKWPYQVSNTGVIRRLGTYAEHSRYGLIFRKPITVAIVVDRYGYSRVGLRMDTKKKFALVSRIVAETFIPNPENKPQVNHINGIKTDNRVENLEWATLQENITHSYLTGLAKVGSSRTQSKLTDTQVLEIRAMKNISQKDIAKIFGVSASLISKIIQKSLWAHL